MQLQSERLFVENSNGSFKASRRNAMSSWISPTHPEFPTKPANEGGVSSSEYDRELLNDHAAKMKRYEPLTTTLTSNGTFNSSVLATISKEFSSGCILHEAISIGVPEQVLMLLVDRFPIFLTQIDGDGRYPVHVACAVGASSKFVSRCIERNPSSAGVKDIEGKTPIHLLCQGTWRGYWAAKSNPTAGKNMSDILSMLYHKAPSSFVSEDNHGVGSVEYAIDSDLGIKFVLNLQEKIGQFKESQARKTTHQKCIVARRQLHKKKTPLAAFEA